MHFSALERALPQKALSPLSLFRALHLSGIKEVRSLDRDRYQQDLWVTISLRPLAARCVFCYIAITFTGISRKKTKTLAF